jgi:class 3 adenylate cyclase/tetratricopeptide (TPR) repeat protein
VDIAAWLRALGLERYEAEFRDNAIDLEILPQLTEADLEKLNVLLGDRKRILRAAATPRTDPALAPLTAPATSAPAGDGAQRRPLTIVFCDLVGSTALSTRLDPEDLREVLRQYQIAVDEEVARLDGFVARYMGDGVLIYFGYPQAHEDDAERALRAGLAIIDRVKSLKIETAELSVRIGIATGLVVVGGTVGSGQTQEHDVIGETPNLASRLQGLAAANTVLISDATRRLVGELFEYRDFGLVSIKGLTEGVPVWQVLRPSEIEGRFAALRSPTLTPLVGRDEEIDLLLRRWMQAKSGDGHIVLLSGEPGIGKSRMTAALRRRLSDEQYTSLQFFSSPHHSDSTLYPFTIHLERAAGLLHTDTVDTKLEKLEAFLSRSANSTADAPALFADLLGLPVETRYPPLPADPQRKRERLLAALVDGLEGLARAQPVLMVCEDVHWIDPTSLTVLKLIVERVPRISVLLIITFRPEFSPPWAGQARVTSLAMNRLEPRESTLLMGRVAGGKALPDQLVARILERTDGIPLFIEELTKALIESGSLREEDDQYVLDGSLPPIAIPSSLHASLLARLDRLASVKDVAQTAAALGREFPYELLAAVVLKPDDELQHALQLLSSAGLIYQRGTTGSIYFIFKHALVQDAAYSTLLRSQRLKLHSRIADTLVERFPETGATRPEILAHHYTEAGSIELAIDFWRLAGEQALRRSANVEAEGHLRRGIELLHSLPATVDRNQRELKLCLALGPAVRARKGHATPEVLDVYSRARQLLDHNATVRERMSVLYGLWIVQFTRWDVVAASELANECLAISEAHRDSDLPVLANSLTGNTLWATGAFTQAHVHLQRSLDLCIAAQNRDRDLRNHEVAVLSFLGFTLFPLGFPEQAAAATRRALVQARATGHVPLTAMALHNQAFMVAAFGADQQLIGTDPEQAQAFCVEHGVAAYEHWARFWQGVILARDGEAAQAIEIMRSSLDAGQRRGVGLFRSVQLAYLAVSYAKVDRPQLSIELFSEAVDLIETWKERFFAAEVHRLYGEVLLELGELREAESKLESALTIARAQQAKMWELRAAVAMERFWRRQGRSTDAHDLLASTCDQFTEGFGTNDLVAARRVIAELE